MTAASRSIRIVLLCPALFPAPSNATPRNESRAFSMRPLRLCALPLLTISCVILKTPLSSTLSSGFWLSWRPQPAGIEIGRVATFHLEDVSFTLQADPQTRSLVVDDRRLISSVEGAGVDRAPRGNAVPIAPPAVLPAVLLEAVLARLITYSALM